MPWLFLVKINKEEQKNFKLKISKNSPFFMPVGLTFNSRNMEHGEIVQIGERMKGTDKYMSYETQEGRGEWGIYGWEDCKIGDILIFHHTVEDNSNTANKQFWVFEDETYNYYAIDFHNIRGFYDGEKIVPHPNFVFLKNIPAFDNPEETDAVTGNKIKKSEGGLFLMADWENSASTIAQKSEAIKEHIESLAKTKNRTADMQIVMEDLEKQRIDMNRKAQKNVFLPYRLAHWNRKLERDFGCKLEDGNVLMCFNKACLYVSNFQDREYSYIICLVDQVGCLVNPEFKKYETVNDKRVEGFDLKIPDNLPEMMEKYGHKENEFSSLK